MVNQSGFTLRELLIVVAIIGILAAIAIPQFGYYLVKKSLANGVTVYSNAKMEYAKEICETENFVEENRATSKQACARLGFVPIEGVPDPKTRNQREQRTYENTLVTKEQLDRIELKMDNILKELAQQAQSCTGAAPVHVHPTEPIKSGGVTW